MSDAGFSILRSHRHICWRMDTLKKPKRFWKPTRFLDIRLTCMDGLPWRCWNSKIDCLLVLCPTVCNNLIDTLQYLNISCNLYMLSLTSQTSRSSAVCEQALEQQALFRYSHHLWSFFWVKEPVSCQSFHSNCKRSSRGSFFLILVMFIVPFWNFGCVYKHVFGVRTANGADHVCCDLVTSSSVGKTPRSARQNVEAIFSPRLNPGSRYHWANTHSNEGKNYGESYRSFGVVNFYDLIFIAVFMIFLFWFVERNCQDMCFLPDWYRQKTTLLSCWLLPLKSHEALDDPRNDVHYLHVEYWFLWNLGSKNLLCLENIW